MLLDQRKSKKEILEELAVMDEEAEPFVQWLEEEKAGLELAFMSLKAYFILFYLIFPLIFIVFHRFSSIFLRRR